MLGSPRSMAKRPLLMGLILFIFSAAMAAGLYVWSTQRPSAQELALDEAAQALDDARIVRKMEHYHPPKPLCDDARPSNDAPVVAWISQLECLEERRRDPRERLVAADEALRHHDVPRLRLERFDILAELGRGEELIRALRGELSSDLSSKQRRGVQLRLARALIFHGTQSWDDRSVEAIGLVEEAGPSTCAEFATALLANVTAKRSDRLAYAERYAALGCTERDDSSQLGVLVELVGVGVSVADLDGAPPEMKSSPARVAENFTVKSPFAMCVSAVPDAPGLRQRCEAILR